MSSISANTEPRWRTERRDHILGATVDLLRDDDPDQVQMDEVAAAAQVGKATLYRYFPSKQALIVACFDSFISQLCDRVEEAEARDAPPPARLEAIVDVATAVLIRHKAFLRLLTRRKGEIDKDAHRTLMNRRERLLAAVRHNIEDGIAAGHYRAADAELVPALILGMLRGATLTDTRTPVEQVARTVADFILNGLTRDAGHRAQTRKK
jgi:AcrR family transcriptional regulator